MTIRRSAHSHHSLLSPDPWQSLSVSGPTSPFVEQPASGDSWYSRLLAWRRTHRFSFLLISLVLLIAFHPFYDETAVRGVIAVRLVTTLVLLSGVYAVADSRRRLAVAALFAVPMLLTGWLYLIRSATMLRLLNHIFSLLFFGSVTVMVLLEVLRARRVTADTVFGAVCVYLLLGVAWSTAYSLTADVVPGSFSVDPAHDLDGALTSQDLFYYSFVTLTTAGYGDITPLSSVARTLSMMEAVCGVLFVAVLIARMVGGMGGGGDGQR